MPENAYNVTGEFTVKPNSNLKPTHIKSEYLYGTYNVGNGRLNIKSILE